MTVCLVRGTNDVGSAVAHALFRAGYSIVLHDEPAPAHARRGMAFVDAMFDGVAWLAGVLAKRSRDLDDLPPMLRCGRAVPAAREPISQVLASVQPDVLVDARMRKRSQPERQIGLARLTIGLGPNFCAGTTTEVAIETGWGDDLGRVIRHGVTRPLEGEPQPIEGIARDRYLYAPIGGIFRTDRRIGDTVSAGTVIASIGETELRAPISGCIRGLTHAGVQVDLHTKVIEIDPRNDPALVFGLGRRPLAIAAGVLTAVQEELSR